MFDISNIQSAGGKHTELLEENYSIHCDQNNSKMILGHGKIFFLGGLCSFAALAALVILLWFDAKLISSQNHWCRLLLHGLRHEAHHRRAID